MIHQTLINVILLLMLFGVKINVSVGLVLQKLDINVFVMEHKLVACVIDAPINLILIILLSVEHVNAKQVFLKLEVNV